MREPLPPVPDSTRFTDLKVVMTLGNALTEIGKNAFYLSAIREMKLPASLRTLGEFCFADCRLLASVTFGNETDGSALEKIGGACFAGCTALNRVTVYKKVAGIADVPVLEQYLPADGQIAYNVFDGIEVPAIYVYGASFYRRTLLGQLRQTDLRNQRLIFLQRGRRRNALPSPFGHFRALLRASGERMSENDEKSSFPMLICNFIRRRLQPKSVC